MKSNPASSEAVATLLFEELRAWEKWLARNHASVRGIWMRLAKKNSDLHSVTNKEAPEAALCYGWIDGQQTIGERNHLAAEIRCARAAKYLVEDQS